MHGSALLERSYRLESDVPLRHKCFCESTSDACDHVYEVMSIRKHMAQEVAPEAAPVISETSPFVMDIVSCGKMRGGRGSMREVSGI